MHLYRFLILCIACFCLTGSVGAQSVAQDTPKQEIERVLASQAQAWNRGDVEGFMKGYAKISTLRFASGSTVTYGWRETLERYKQRYSERAVMGTLVFSDLDTSVLSPDAAVVFGHWRLKDVKGEPNGLFTLVLRKTDLGWQIVADHTSAAN